MLFRNAILRFGYRHLLRVWDKMKVVSVTAAGRRETLKALIPHLLSARRQICEHWFWVNTSNESDLRYIEEACDRWGDFFKLVARKGADRRGPVSPLYKTCVEPDTLYIKIDDDMVWFDDYALKNLIEFRIRHPQFFLVYGNVINNVMCTHLHERMGLVKPRLGHAGWDPFDSVGWSRWETAADCHDALIKHIEDDTLCKYDFGQWEMRPGERMGIGLCSWLGKQFAEFSGEVSHADDEHWLTVDYARKRNLSSCICGGALAAHFSYRTQEELAVKRPDIMLSYDQLARLRLARNEL